MAFGVTKKGVPIQEAGLRSRLNVGIVIPRFGDIVPEYEEREAAVYVQCNWSQWLRLNWYDRAASVAQYRTHYLIESHVNDELHNKAKKPSRSKR